jgi:hypothetical protein
MCIACALVAIVPPSPRFLPRLGWALVALSSITAAGTIAAL